MGNYHVFTIGDALITLNPFKTGKLRNNTGFEQSVGGAELNFAIGCARLGLNATWMSRLGNDEFGKYILKKVRGENVQTNYVEFVDGYPTSLNFKQINDDGSGSTFYYRYQSPILTLTPEHITPELFDGVDLVHLTGVFLAVANHNLAVALKICDVAKAKNIPISFDPNIRLKLWTIEEARSAYVQIFPYIDVFLTGLDEFKLITQSTNIEVFAKHYDIKQVVIKDGANGSKAYVDGDWFEMPPYKVKAVDTVGAGDGFDAGYIYSYLHGKSVKESLDFANAIGAMVVSVKGDNEGLPELEDVEVFLGRKKVIER